MYRDFYSADCLTTLPNLCKSHAQSMLTLATRGYLRLVLLANRVPVGRLYGVLKLLVVPSYPMLSGTWAMRSIWFNHTRQRRLKTTVKPYKFLFVVL